MEVHWANAQATEARETVFAANTIRINSFINYEIEISKTKKALRKPLRQDSLPKVARNQTLLALSCRCIETLPWTWRRES